MPETVVIQAELAATELREALDNDAAVAREEEVNLRLSFMVQRSNCKEAIMTLVQTTIRSVQKSATWPGQLPTSPSHQPRSSQGYPKGTPRVPHVHNTIRDAAAGAAFYPQERMQYGSAVPPPPPSGLELCKGFAKGSCRFGNACRFVHEQGLPPPRLRNSLGPAQQK